MIKKIKLSENVNILLIKLRALGDVLLSTPAISTLKKSFPGCSIDFAVLKENHEIVEHNPLLREVFILDKAWDKLPLFKRLKKYREFIQDLKKVKYDVVIDLQNSPRSIWLGFFSKGRYKIGYTKPQNFFYTYRLKQVNRVQHNVDDLLYLLSPLSPVDITRSLSLSYPEIISEDLEKRLNLSKRSYVIIHPGAGRRRRFKMWGINNFSRVAEEIIKMNYEVFIVGGPGDSDLIEEFKNELGQQEKIFYFDNEFSILSLAALISKARLFIGNDSGPLHISDAMNTPAIGIFGASSPLRWGVIKPPHLNIYKQIECNPCDKVKCKFERTKCLEAIQPADIINNLKYFL
ncbi:MAG: glycosyltransferase family 9 protein [bacterium]|nr:glycosyltransferase family 9 protein [bacterium]